MPHPKPVDKIELSSGHVRLRLILTVAFLIVGSCFLAYSVSQLSARGPGWCEVEVSSSELNCGDDFILRYCLGEGSMSATAEYKAIAACYTEATEYAFQMFTNDVAYEGVCNLYYISRHPNEEILVDDALYQAFSLIQSMQDRRVYLAPVYEQYNGLFPCTEEYQTVEFDPRQNLSIAEYYAEIAGFANDPQMIDLELLGDNRVLLKVSEAYLSFAAENEIESFLDFSWMKNAFIVDYLADTLLENGFCYGYLSSYDGFLRNLDTRGQTYVVNLYDRQGMDIYLPAQLQYTAPASVVVLRNYPMTEQDGWHYYTYASGEIVTAFLDPTDGISKSATDNLVSYGVDVGCAEILLQTAPVFIADVFRPEALKALAENGIYSVWCEETVIKYNDQSADLVLLEDSGEMQYTISFDTDS